VPDDRPPDPLTAARAEREEVRRQLAELYAELAGRSREALVDRIEVTGYSTLICEMLTAGRRDPQALIIWSTFASSLIGQLEDLEPVPAVLAKLAGRFPPDWRAVRLAWQHGVITGAILNALRI
jgi:hypothetical protein